MTSTLYKPLALLFSVAGGVVAGRVFGQVWKLISDEDEPPDATSEDYSLGEILVAAAVQGAVFGLVKAAIDRGGARGFQKVTGVWPGR